MKQDFCNRIICFWFYYKCITGHYNPLYQFTFMLLCELLKGYYTNIGQYVTDACPLGDEVLYILWIATLSYIPRYTAVDITREMMNTPRREYRRIWNLYKELNVVTQQKGVDDESERESVQVKTIDAESACRTTFAQNFELSITIQNNEFSKFRVCRFLMEQVF